MDWKNIREQFPVTEEYLYLDAAHKSALPLYTTKALENYFRNQQMTGGDKEEWKKTISDAKANFGKLVNADPLEIAFVKNTSEGLNIAANGIPFKPGDNVILNNNEHPNNIYCWLNLESKGVEVRWAPTRSGQVSVRDIESLMDKNTRALSVSSVTYMPGNRNDVKAIGTLCNERGVYLIVDTVQSMGLLNFDVKELGVDMFATSGHKGLNAPHGTGVFFCRKEIIPEIKSYFVARSGLAGHAALQHDSLEYMLTISDTANKFEIGNHNFSAITALNESLKVINAIGIQEIEKRILELSGQLTEGLQQLGANVVTPIQDEFRSGIVCFRTKDTLDLYHKLVQKKVITSYRRDSIRASIGIYNSSEDVNTFLDYVNELS